MRTTERAAGRSNGLSIRGCATAGRVQGSRRRSTEGTIDFSYLRYRGVSQHRNRLRDAPAKNSRAAVDRLIFTNKKQFEFLKVLKLRNDRLRKSYVYSYRLIVIEIKY